MKALNLSTNGQMTVLVTVLLGRNYVFPIQEVRKVILQTVFEQQNVVTLPSGILAFFRDSQLFTLQKFWILSLVTNASELKSFVNIATDAICLPDSIVECPAWCECCNKKKKI